MTRAFLSLCLLAGFAHGQVPGRAIPNRPGFPPPTGSPTDSTPSLKPGSVEGIVTNSVTGEPVKKATVMLRSNTQRFAYGGVTDMAGHFVIQNVEPGAYTANASADGYQQDQTRRGLLKAISVGEEQHVTDVSLKLIPLAIVNGKVLDEEGEPIAGANVIAMRYFYFNGRKQLNTSYFGNTNDLGEFQLLDLQPGRYYFQVTANLAQVFAQRPVQSSGPDETYPPIFYPNALDIGQATSTALDAGAQLNNVDFRLRKSRSYRVRGKVVDANGQPARNLNVQITPRTIPNGFARIGGMVQQDGSFEIRGVLSGEYDVMCQRQESGQPMAARQTIQVGEENVEGVVLALAPGFDVTGAIQTEGTPAPTSDGRLPAAAAARADRTPAGRSARFFAPRHARPGWDARFPQRDARPLPTPRDA